MAQQPLLGLQARLWGMHPLQEHMVTTQQQPEYLCSHSRNYEDLKALDLRLQPPFCNGNLFIWTLLVWQIKDLAS